MKMIMSMYIFTYLHRILSIVYLVYQINPSTSSNVVFSQLLTKHSVSGLLTRFSKVFLNLNSGSAQMFLLMAYKFWLCSVLFVCALGKERWWYQSPEQRRPIKNAKCTTSVSNTSSYAFWQKLNIKCRHKTIQII